MPLPPGVTTRTYQGTIVGLDGSNATGMLEFRQPKPIYDTANNVVVGPQKPITATVTAGAFTAQLPVSPWQYVVRIATDAIKDVYLLLVEAGATPLTFADTYLAAGSPDLADFYVLHATFNALADRVADLEETGGVTVPDATSTTKGALRLTGDLAGTADAPTVPGLAGKYVKPGSGIPQTDLAAAVQTLLTLAGTAVQPGALATVATSGAYTDLTGRPTIPDSYDDLTGTVPTAALPAIAVTEYLGAAANQAAMLALAGQLGDWCTRTDLGATWIITGADPTQLASWTALSYPAAPVVSVNGQSGVVVLAKADVGLGNVSNLAPADLGISAATQTALDTKQAADADLAAIAELAPADNDLLQRVAGAWTNRTLAQVKTSLDLNLVDNTADAAKPVSTAQAAADANRGVQATASSGIAHDVFTGDTSGAWTPCPANYRVTIPAAVGDVLHWEPHLLVNVGADAELDVASLVSGAPARYFSSGTTAQGANGHGGLYIGTGYNRALKPIRWIVTADDLDSGNVTLALMYRSGAGVTFGHAVYPGQVDLTNHGTAA